ncbi:VCBS repeat protein [Dyadobacter jejuensis]|uniref:VCBS repeat protein n=1 Tax=Dyadobacter jejuensis TaxID=1082580 RepID=A0A316ASB9_9BACT|nr:VCBS repeat-containing protein [Dyadobacter jejuensis]PWJ60418.1 VCBS repeat protein [Dyadobacter jejuensis]
MKNWIRRLRNGWLRVASNLGLVCLLLIGTSRCTSKKNGVDPLFRLHMEEETGLNFSNQLTSDKSFNIFYYMYFYNGGGVAAGDLNNDGLVDLCFTANQEPNRIFINKGNLKFEDITEKANVAEGKGWSTGVSVVDINQDGLLDLYISQVGDYEGMRGHNLLYICQEITPEGIPVYKEMSEEYGLDLVVFGTQALFFDFDLDGDLDMFQLNHSVHQNGTFGKRAFFEKQYHPMAGDRLFENKDGKYVDITLKAGIHSSALGYGLGLGVGDLNLDGFPDLYVGNDFHENDYLYMNLGNGRFDDRAAQALRHTSQFSMGVDVADLDNDLMPEIVSLDMLPSDYEILKKSEGEDSYSIFNYKLQQGYSHQYARNNLQRNNGNGTYSEIGLYAGVPATDWSWSSLFADFDNDGLKDLFISNGIPKRMNDIDYIRYVANDVVQQKIKDRNFDENDPSLADKLPEIKLKNKFFRNQGALQFEDLEAKIQNDRTSYSNGAVYADLDNDGDLDLVTNNINDKVFLYENVSVRSPNKNDYIRLYLKGDSLNRNAIGAKCVVYKGSGAQLYEKFPVRGFLSSMELPIHMGVGNRDEVDSIALIWPNGHYQVIAHSELADSLNLQYLTGLPRFNYSLLQDFNATSTHFPHFVDRAQQAGLYLKHTENNFVEFDRNSLIPFETTAEGPAVAVADVNHDGLEDVFLGSAKNGKARLMLQTKEGRFQEKYQPALSRDSTYEEIDAQWVDVNQDGHLDLVVATGGNEFFNRSVYQQPRLYLNDGTGTLTARPDAFKDIYVTASCVVSHDFTGDGYVDLFIGGRAVPTAYGEVPHSYLLKNDGHGRFTEVTDQYASGLSQIGYVKDAVWVDMDRDEDKDLVVATEWGGIYLFVNRPKGFDQRVITDQRGWWNFVFPVDVDGDGDMDLLAGNLGLNSRLKASKDQPVHLYVNDYDQNGRNEPILTHYLNGVESLFPTKMELEKQIPLIRKKYNLASEFSKASFETILGEDKIKASKKWTADSFETTLFLNDGKGNYVAKPLPYKAQWAPYYASAVVEANQDSLPDFLLMGNFYESNVQMGRYDADYGSLLINRGKGHFDVEKIPELSITGQVKKIRKIRVGGEEMFLVVRNNDYLMLLSKGVSLK